MCKKITWKKIWTRTKEWFFKYWNSFIIALVITLSLFFLVSLLTRWSIIGIFVIALAYKMWKNQPF
jgi:hypothetical protein